MGLAAVGSLVEDAIVDAVEVKMPVLMVVASGDWGDNEVVKVRTDGDDIEAGAGIDVDIGLNV